MAAVPLILTLLLFISSSAACMKMIPPDDMEGLPSTETPMYTTATPVKTTILTTAMTATTALVEATTTKVETTTEMGCGCELPSTDLSKAECEAINLPTIELEQTDTQLGTKFMDGECFLDYTCTYVMFTAKTPECFTQGAQQAHAEYKCMNGEWAGTWTDPPTILDKLTCGV